MPMLSFRISEDLAARVDAAAEGNRSAWIKRALEQALEGPAQNPPAVRSDPVPVTPDRVAAFRRADVLRRAGK